MGVKEPTIAPRGESPLSLVRPVRCGNGRPGLRAHHKTLDEVLANSADRRAAVRAARDSALGKARSDLGETGVRTSRLVITEGPLSDTIGRYPCCLCSHVGRGLGHPIGPGSATFQRGVSASRRSFSFGIVGGMCFSGNRRSIRIGRRRVVFRSGEFEASKRKKAGSCRRVTS